jgi:hypothetical protein
MDEAAQRTLIKSETGRTIESTQPGAARRANTLRIERISVDERRAADGAEIFGLERSRGVQALFADRNPGPLEEGAIADPAIIGEKQRKNTVGDPANEMEGSRSRQSATREGAPPDISPISN